MDFLQGEKKQYQTLNSAAIAAQVATSSSPSFGVHESEDAGSPCRDPFKNHAQTRTSKISQPKVLALLHRRLS